MKVKVLGKWYAVISIQFYEFGASVSYINDGSDFKISVVSFGFKELKEKVKFMKG